MKRLLALAVSAAVLMSVAVGNMFSASAETQVFVDDASGNSTTELNVYKYGPDGCWQWENNSELGATFYDKHNTTAETWLEYKVDGSITNFNIKGFDCAGFGDMGRDIDCYLSSDETNWVKADVSATEQTPNDNYPPNSAYWFDQTLTSNGTISGNYSYLKIVLKQYPKVGADGTADNIAWAIGIDKVSIQYSTGAAETTAAPTTEPTAAPTETTAKAPTEAPTTEAATSASTAAPTTAVTTAPQGPVSGQIVDDCDDTFSKVLERSPNTQFENNAEIGRTLYSKAKVADSKPKDPDQDSYFTYYTASNITGFSIDALICNGWGDLDRDAAYFVSKDNSTWVPVAQQHTELQVEPTYAGKPDEQVYWKTSTVTNAEAIQAGDGYHYFKIVLKAVDKAGGFPLWSVVLDKITVNYEETSGTTAASETTGQSATTAATTAGTAVSTTAAPVSTTAAETTAGTSENETSPKTGDSALPIALFGLSVLSAGALLASRKHKGR